MLSQVIVRYRILILMAAGAVMIGAGLYGGGVADSLSNGGFDDPEAESVAAAKLLSERFGVTPAGAILVLRTDTGTVDDPAVVAKGMALVESLTAEAHVISVNSYWTLGSPASLRSDAGDEALIFVSIEGDQGQIVTRGGELAEKYRSSGGNIEVLVGGQGPVFAAVQDTIEADLVKAESIAFPITLILLAIIFGSVVAAFLPLGVGILSIIGTFGILQLLTRFTEVSIYALNLTTALGLGLAIDYALFVVSRFREELAAGHDRETAAIRTIKTAGRTVLFSAGTVAVSLAAMLVFPLPFLRSFGYAGIAVVTMAALGAVVVLPALLAVLGSKIEKLKIRTVSTNSGADGVWHRVATTVMRRPIPIATAVIALLIFLGSPFLDARLASSDDRVLAPGSEARAVGDLLRQDFTAFEAGSIEVVTVTGGFDSAIAESVAGALSALEDVARVDGPSGSFVDGVNVIPAGPASMRFVSDAGFYLQVVPHVDPTSEAAEKLVTAIRGMDLPVDVLVAGAPAELVDTKRALFEALPWAISIIVVVTFVVLFLMFGSVLVPVKAVILNVLSLSATFGSLVWIFQKGNLANFLDFTPTGALDLTIPILMFCIAFGLSMDYEVFLLSRIKEEHDSGSDNVAAVAMGLERTGRIVTAAAVLIAVVFVAFATSSVTIIKTFGLGMTLAVLVDAFLIRSTLVPAFMRLAGDANWWAPAPLRRVHDRFGISESAKLPPMIRPTEV